MTKANREAFLAALHVGVLAVADDSGGAPVAVPVWYRYEPGGDVVMSLGTDGVGLDGDAAKHAMLDAARWLLTGALAELDSADPEHASLGVIP